MAQRTVPAISREELLDRVNRLPRVPFAHLPTPLEEMPRLREALGPRAPRLLVKRDDLTGFALGGNKVRHLEYRLADIRAHGADTIIVANVAQSNHARLHAALAARFGLTTYILKIPSHKDTPVNGNLLLDHIVGARIVEAYPVDPRGQAVEAVRSFTGLAPAFERAGFVEVARRSDRRPIMRYVIVPAP